MNTYKPEFGGPGQRSIAGSRSTCCLPEIMASAAQIEPGLSEYGLISRGMEIKPGMNGKIPDLNKPIRSASRVCKL